MSKAPWINEEIQKKLAVAYLNSCGENNKVPETKDFIQDLKRRDAYDLRKEFGEVFRLPGLNWFNKTGNVPTWKKKWEKHKVEPSEEDRTWNLGTLDEFPIPEDVIPIVFRIQKKIDKKITIRTVKWLARVHTMLKDDEPLYFWARMYAEREQVYKLADTAPYDSSELDAKLLDGNLFSMPIVNLFHNMFYQWLIRNENLLSKEQKECIGKMLIRQTEDAFNTLSASGWEEGEEWEKGVPADIWLFYMSSIMKRAGDSGYFGEYCLDELEVLLGKLGGKFPNNLHMLTPINLESWKHH
jgi:hypothetical protein